MRRLIFATTTAVCLACGGINLVNAGGPTRQTTGRRSAAPVIEWSTEARRAIVPPGPSGIFGTENYGNKFPGEAAIYMGIVHAAIYDTAVAIEGGYRPYAIALSAPENTSAQAAIATAVHHVLIGLQPALGLTAARQADLDGRYATYLGTVSDQTAKANGIAIGEQVTAALLALRQNDGRDLNPRIEDLNPPPPNPGIWEEGPTPAVGLRVPGIRPLVLGRGSQFRPDGPNPLASAEYARDFQQVAALGRGDSSSTRTEKQTIQALFWTDHDLRQWNDGMLNLAMEYGLDLVQTARMLAMAHAAGADAMIACFDAKYTYWFWRPFQAIPRAGEDPNPATVADPGWQPLRTTPSFPEYPSAHACHTSAVAEALSAFFGTDRISFSLDSRASRTTRTYSRFHDVIRDVNQARVLVGFHFRNSDQEGSTLGRKVARYVLRHRF